MGSAPVPHAESEGEPEVVGRGERDGEEGESSRDPEDVHRAPQNGREGASKGKAILQGDTEVEDATGHVWKIQAWHEQATDGDRLKVFCPHGERDERSEAGEAWIRRYEHCTYLQCDRSSHGHPAPLKGTYHPGRTAPSGSDARVLELLDLTGTGEIKGSLKNVTTILAEDPHWRGRIWFDLFHLKPMIKVDEQDVLVEDHHQSEAAIWIDAHYGISLTTAHVREAFAVVGRRQGRDPLVDHLDAMPAWDGTPRLGWFVEKALHVPADDPAYNVYAWMFTRWTISAVARAYEGGCQADAALILKGAQGLKKSSALKEFAGAEWYSASPIPIDKAGDTVQALRAAWIHEWAELETVRRRDNAQVRAFVTMQVDRGRLAYAHNMVEAPRRSVFCGSTNEDEFLSDPTGSRRYWVIPVEQQANLDWIREHRDQLWAEAISMYRRGEPWHFERPQEEYIQGLNTEYEEEEPFAAQVAMWLEQRGNFGFVDPATGQRVWTPFTVGDVLSGIGVLLAQHKGHHKRIGAMLRKIGCANRKHSNRRVFWPPAAGPTPWVPVAVSPPPIQATSPSGPQDAGDERPPNDNDQPWYEET